MAKSGLSFSALIACSSENGCLLNADKYIYITTQQSWDQIYQNGFGLLKVIGKILMLPHLYN